MQPWAWATLNQPCIPSGSLNRVPPSAGVASEVTTLWRYTNLFIIIIIIIINGGMPHLPGGR